MIFKKLVSFFLSLLAFVGVLFAQPTQKVSGKAKKLFDIALENYRQRLRKEVSVIYVCRPQDNHRWVSVSSAVYQNRYKKKYEYY